jgi:hypothetical protein
MYKFYLRLRCLNRDFYKIFGICGKLSEPGLLQDFYDLREIVKKLKKISDKPLKYHSIKFCATISACLVF